MTTQLDKLVIDTEFTYEGKQYIKGSYVWHINGAKDSVLILGQGESGVLRKCHPKLGGHFQTEIDVWFHIETLVTAE